MKSTTTSTKSTAAATALVVLAAWTLFAFAGAYLWTLLPLLVGALVLVITVRPPVGRPTERIFDAALAVCLIVIALQLAPVSPSVRLALSPQIGRVEQALWVGAPLDPLSGPAGPLSVDPGGTCVALALALVFVLVFWSARAVFASRGVRAVARGIAWTGLALAVVAMAQHATAPRLLYWRWPTIFGTAFSPYRNRNDFATWLIMAIPLTVGYLLARFASQTRENGGPGDLHSLVDATAVWLAGSACLMSAALLASLSRSGLMGATAGLTCFLWLSRGRMSHRGRGSLLVGAAAAVLIATTYVSVGALADRVGETLQAGIGGRRTIWRDTLPMVRDFRVAGVGAGAYERAMLVYQRSKGLFYINHAHNEYLQIAAEGGVLVGIPAIIVLVAGVSLIVRRLGNDHAPVFWIRAGAASALLAVAVQSVWDTGLRMPANGLLFALVAAIAVHKRER